VKNPHIIFSNEPKKDPLKGNLDFYKEIEKQKKQLEIAKETLELLSKCSGGCDGPMGCMCKAKHAIKAIEEIERVE